MISLPYFLSISAVILILAGAVGFFLARAGCSREFSRRLAQQQSEAAILRERLANQQTVIDAAEGKAAELEDHLTRTGEQLKNALQERARLEEQTRRLADLEKILAEKDAALTGLHGENRALAEQVRELEERLGREKKEAEERLALVMEARQELTTVFKAVSNDIFKSSSKTFVDMARATLGEAQARAAKDLELRRQSIQELVKPLTESLQKVDTQMRLLEKERTEAYAGLRQQIKSMAESQARLQSETANLVKALRTPNVRGRWGEIQLRRVVEMAGMLEHCDFLEQQTADGDHGRLRPDMIIKLPGDKNIVVDSKAALSAYLEATEAKTEEEKKRKLTEHARQIRDHLTKLANKSYWEQFQPSPEFVVLFLPGENFFSAALEHDPQLIEFGVTQRVILATPTTLIALLRAVSYGWRQEQIAESAQAIAALGKELHDRLNVMTRHFIDMRLGLDRAVDAYNKAVGSFESRVLVSARRFHEIDSSVTEKIPALESITTMPRIPQENDLNP